MASIARETAGRAAREACGRIALIVFAVILGLLILNALALSNQTKDAEVNVDGAEIVETSVGGLQVLDEGDPRGPPIVLIHCYACSMHWYDELAPELTEVTGWSGSSCSATAARTSRRRATGSRSRRGGSRRPLPS